MAIVKEVTVSTGARCRFMDDDYAGVSSEVLADRKACTNRNAYQILLNYAKRQEANESAGGQG